MTAPIETRWQRFERAALADVSDADRDAARSLFFCGAFAALRVVQTTKRTNEMRDELYHFVNVTMDQQQ